LHLIPQIINKQVALTSIAVAPSHIQRHNHFISPHNAHCLHEKDSGKAWRENNNEHRFRTDSQEHTIDPTCLAALSQGKQRKLRVSV